MSAPSARPPRSVAVLVVASLVCLAAGVGLSVYAAVQIAAEPVAPPAATAPALSDQEIIEAFHRLSYGSSEWAEMTWMGVRTLQHPADMWMIQEIIHEVQPEFIIETGTFHGGSTLFFAMVLEELGGPGKVLSIDIEPRVKLAQRSPTFRKRVEVFTGSSVDPALVASIAERVRGRRVLVLLDSDHRRDHVLAELRAFGPLVSPGSYLIVQDTNLNGHPVLPEHGPGPYEAIQDFLKETDAFEIDRSRERFLVTYYPSGYLRRVAAAAQGG